MGQYYNIYLEREKGDKINFNRKVGDGYVLAKIMEHSWIPNDTMKTVCAFIRNKPARVAWVGDYYDEVKGYDKEMYDFIRDESTPRSMAKRGFNYKGKYLVNITKKEYLSFDTYIKNSTDIEGWCLHPLSLLTACGNGIGSGDYEGTDMDLVGSWAKDLLIILKEKPSNCKEIAPIFKERGWQ